MGVWILPALGYVVTIGLFGIISKFAFRHVTWPELVVWTAAIYVVVAFVLVFSGTAHLRFDIGTGYALLTGGLALGGLIALLIALQLGPASRVIPFTSIYPIVTVFLSALFLAEHITPQIWAGVVLIIAGAIVINL